MIDLRGKPNRADVGARRDPYGAFSFQVEFDGLVAGGFSEASGLQVEVEVQDYREGGRNDYIHRLAGPARYPQNLVLKRGLTDNDTLWAWCAEVATGTIRRRNGTIYLMGYDGQPALAWNVREAYPVKWSGPELRAGSTQVAIETIELVHRGISPTATRR